VADEPIGPPDAYGDDRLFAYLRNADEPDEELDAKVDALADGGQPVLTLSVHGPTDLGRVFFFAEFAVAVGGWAMGINPFDQPNVQEAKDNTDKVLEGYRAEGRLPEVADADDGALRALLSDAGPPDYVAVLGYLEPSARFDRAVVPTRLVIFGATGDLAKRRLLPAVYNLAQEGSLPERFNLIGVSRSDKTHDEFRAEMRDAITQFSRTPPNGEVLDALLENVRYVPGSFDDSTVYDALGHQLDEFDAAAEIVFNRVFYLSTAPEFFPVIVVALGEAKLN